MAITTARGIILQKDLPPLPMMNNSKPEIQAPIDQTTFSYTNILKPIPITPPIPKVPPKTVIILHGEPNITWKFLKVRSLIIHESL